MQHYQDQPKQVSQFVLSVDDMMGKEAQVVLATLSQLLAAKMEELILHIKGWFKGWIVFTVARSYSKVIHRAWVPSPLRTWYLGWESGLVLGLAQLISCAKIGLCTPAQTFPFESTLPLVLRNVLCLRNITPTPATAGR